MTDKRRVRVRVLPIAVISALAIGVVLAACVDSTKVLGEECVKSDDCQSGLCESFVCVAAPPFLMVPPANTSDAGEASAPDSAADTATTDANDAGGDAE
jgi:hypothetical protein